MKKWYIIPRSIVLFIVLLIFSSGCGVTEPTKTISYEAFSRGTPGGNNCDGVASFSCDGDWFYGGWCSRSFIIGIIDYNSGEILNPGVTFDTWRSRGEKTRMLAFLDSIPNNRMIIVAICDDAGFNRNPTEQINEDIRVYFESLGSVKIRDYIFRDSWAFIAIKGRGVALDEVFAENGQPVTAKTTLEIKK